jgi:hypothetical protein
MPMLRFSETGNRANQIEVYNGEAANGRYSY